MRLNDRLRIHAFDNGADYFGVAGLLSARDAILEQGGPVVAAYPCAVSIGIRLLDPLVDGLLHGKETQAALTYRHHCYDIINLRLDLLASSIGSEIQREGYKAFPVPASKRYSDERISSIFSHKMAAHLAGMGWIGKNCLLVTPDAGPRVRWATILTDAPLEEGIPIKEQCGDCRKCVDICPQKAFTGRPFKEDEPREARFDAGKCDRHFKEMEKAGKQAVCGLCLYICPYGGSGIK